jgi:hypothetical protein
VFAHRRAFYHAESLAAPDAVNDTVASTVASTVGRRLTVTS